MAFILNYAVIHSFEKTQYQKGINPKKTVIQPLFDTTKPTVIKLVQDIHVLLGKEKNKVYWGQFSNNKRGGSFPDSIREHLKKPDTDTFEKLSHKTLEELIKQAKDELLATGGHTLIAKYQSEGKDFLLVTNIKEKEGLRLGKNYEPIESSNIDLTQILQAARINLKKFTEIESNPETPLSIEADKTYLCFISKGKADASKYFIEALGCEKGITSARATKNTIECTYNYFKDNQSLSPYKKAAKENVIRYLKSRLEDKESENTGKASIDGIVNAAKSAIPPEKSELQNEVENLKTELNSEHHQVPDEFSVNPAEIKKRTKIKGGTAHWDLEFEISSLGENANSSVFYDRNSSTITLSAIPEDFIKKIEKQLNEDE